jgi:hypothetical protein
MARIAAVAAAAAAALVADDATEQQEQPAQIAAATVDSGRQSKRSHGDAAAPQASAAAAADSSLEPSKRCRRGATLLNVSAMPTRTAQLPFGVAAGQVDPPCRLFISPDRAWVTDAVLGAVEEAVLAAAAAQAAEALME